MESFDVRTSKHAQFVNIDREVQGVVTASGAERGSITPVSDWMGTDGRILSVTTDSDAISSRRLTDGLDRSLRLPG